MVYNPKYVAKISNIYMRHFYIYTPLRYIPHYDYLVYMPHNDNSVIYMPNKYICPIIFYSYINYNRTDIYVLGPQIGLCVSIQIYIYGSFKTICRNKRHKIYFSEALYCNCIKTVSNCWPTRKSPFYRPII